MATLETQPSLFHLEVWSFPSISHSENRRHIDPVWISSQQSCLCPLLSFGPWCKPCCSQENWPALVLGSYVWLVWMNHRIAYCLFSGQMSRGHLAAIKLGSPKIMLEVGRRAHSGKVCHLHEGLCVHASSFFPSFARDAPYKNGYLHNDQPNAASLQAPHLYMNLMQIDSHASRH